MVLTKCTIRGHGKYFETGPRVEPLHKWSHGLSIWCVRLETGGHVNCAHYRITLYFMQSSRKMCDSWPLKIFWNLASCWTTDLMELITVNLSNWFDLRQVATNLALTPGSIYTSLRSYRQNVRFMAIENILKLGLARMNKFHGVNFWLDLR